MAEQYTLRRLITIIVAIVVCIALVVTLLFVLSPMMKYKKAEKLVLSGDYEEAISIFLDLGDYKDSAEQVVNSRLLHIKNSKIGDYVEFGYYEQNNDLADGPEPIEWIVLHKKGPRVLVISRYALDSQPYNTSNKYVVSGQLKQPI